MTLKQLTVGSMVIMIIIIMISMGMNTAVDKSIEVTDQILDNQTVNDPSIRSGNEPLRAIVETDSDPNQLLGTHGSVTIQNGQTEPNIFQSFMQKIMLAIINQVDDTQNTDKETDSYNPATSMNYEQIMEKYPLDEEQQAELKLYTDMSPAELIETYCTDAQSPEFQEMTESIKESYQNDPNSPAALMEMFETMAKLCPATK